MSGLQALWGISLRTLNAQHRLLATYWGEERVLLAGVALGGGLLDGLRRSGRNAGWANRNGPIGVQRE